MEQEQLAQIVALRRTLHSCPERAGREAQTKARLMAFLAANTSLTLHDQGLWFYAAHREVLPRRLPPRAERLCAAALGTALAAVYLYRLFWQQPSAIAPCWEGSLLAGLLSFAGVVPA